MKLELPDYYFRTRENGAQVFRVSTDNPQQRIEMNPIAAINIRNGEIRPHADHLLTGEDNKAIAQWIETRQQELQGREIDDIRRTIDHLNHMAHWVNSKAAPEVLDKVTDEILLAMHDLRQVLVHKRAERVRKATK